MSISYFTAIAYKTIPDKSQSQPQSESDQGDFLRKDEIVRNSSSIKLIITEIDYPIIQPTPAILSITILTFSANTYSITIGNYNFIITYDTQLLLSRTTLINNTDVLTIGYPVVLTDYRHICLNMGGSIANSRTIKVILEPSNDNMYIAGDTYLIHLVLNDANEFIGAMVSFSRRKQLDISIPNTTDGLNTISNIIINTNPSTEINQSEISYSGCDSFTENICINDSKNIRVPIISIFGQTTIDGSDVGEIIFAVCDEYTYYKSKKLSSNHSTIDYINPSQLKLTLYREYCPIMGAVLDGFGSTAYSKALYLHEKSKLTMNVNTFYSNLLLYGMMKYHLSRILYGNFNVNYLLGKNTNKFLKDLKSSRFCNFVTYFLDSKSPVYEYHNYFRYE